jgi:hypothetical protein
LVAALVGTGSALSACGAPVRPTGPSNAEASAYLSPPTVAAAFRTPGGEVRLVGRSPPGALVRLQSPGGGTVTAVADADGRWTLAPPCATEPPSPCLYALQAQTHDQSLRGEGALAVIPAPAPAAIVLRPGFASAPTGRDEAGRLQLVSFDYDGEAVAASGFAPPQSQVRLAVDGVTMGVGAADSEGRFGVLGVAARKTLPGRHTVRVETRQGLSVERSVTTAAPALADGRPFAAAPAPGGWTISWRLGGGGVQTSQVFDDAIALPAQTAPGR